MLNLQSKFAIQETRSVPDWWGLGFTFVIAWIGNKAHRDWIEKNAANDDKSEGELLKLLGKAQAGAMVESQGLRGKKKQDAFEAGLVRRFDSLLAGAELAEVSFEGLKPEGLARHVIRNISGLKRVDVDSGEEVDIEYTWEVGVELMEDQTPLTDALVVQPSSKEAERVRELYIDEGTPLGQAIKQAVVWEANRHQLYRQAWLESAAGN